VEYGVQLTQVAAEGSKLYAYIALAPRYQSKRQANHEATAYMAHVGIQPANHGCSIEFQSIYSYLLKLHLISHGNNDGDAILLLLQCIEAKEKADHETVATAYMHAI